MLDYLILINKFHKISDEYFCNINFASYLNQNNDNILIESRCLLGFEKLKRELLSLGVIIDIEDGFRSFEVQNKLYAKFQNLYGTEYTKKYVALPGFSEHHTGLAIDIQLVKEDHKVLSNEELLHADFSLIHSRLKKFGFILRYPKGKENITGYEYEPWHFRFVGMEHVNKFNDGQTLEEVVLN